MTLPALLNRTSPAPTDLVAQHLAEARKLARLGLGVIGVALVPALGWLVFAPLSSAVVAPGFVKVDLNRSTVQHAEGGSVREVFVRDGQHVKAGEPLIALGDVSVSADKTRLGQRLLAERAGLARLEAEQNRRNRLVFPPDLLNATRSDPSLREQLDKEQSLFSARLHALDSQTALLRSQKLKIAGEIKSLQAQVQSTRDSIKAQTQEYDVNEKMARDGLVSATRVMQLDAALADYRGTMAARQADLARADQRIGDLDLRISQLDNDYRQQASDQLKVATARSQEVEQELRKATDASSRQVVVAPVDGEVIGLRVTTPGTVLAPREPIAEIVPSNPRLVVEARIRPEDVNRVHRGQKADLRFTAFRYRTSHPVTGTVVYVGGDRLVDKENGAGYFTVTVDVAPDAVAQASKVADDRKLQAGMPAEVYFAGEDRTALQYLMTPLTQVMRRAGRER